VLGFVFAEVAQVRLQIFACEKDAGAMGALYGLVVVFGFAHSLRLVYV
jgi:hypothetical protein